MDAVDDQPPWVKHVRELDFCLRELEKDNDQTERLSIGLRGDRALEALCVLLGQARPPFWQRPAVRRGIERARAWYKPRRRQVLALCLLGAALLVVLHRWLEKRHPVIAWIVGGVAGVLAMAPQVDDYLGGGEG